jgi:hypothetical protein
MSDWAAAVSALIAGLGLLFAGGQLALLNRQARYERRVAYEGVVVSWYPLETPQHPDRDGSAAWLYEVTANNPGRLPIDHIEVRLVFPCKVRRVHYNGTMDEPTSELTMTTPVLAGGATRQWRRRLRIDFADRDDLNGTFAQITFVDIDNRSHTNRWPREAGARRR